MQVFTQTDLLFIFILSIPFIIHTLQEGSFAEKIHLENYFKPATVDFFSFSF